MWWKSVAEWWKASKANRLIAVVSAVLLIGACVAAYDSCAQRRQASASKKAEQAQAAEAKRIEEKARVEKEAFDKTAGTQAKRVEEVLTEIRAVKANIARTSANLARVEALRMEPWRVPAVDNGDLAARFDRALEALR